MKELKAGFARIDITPQLGVDIVGYMNVRIADGILDPLLATAVAVSDGDTTAIIMSLDLIGMCQEGTAMVKDIIHKETGVSKDAIYITCTHTHLGPAVSKGYACWSEDVAVIIYKKLGGLAKMAIDDLKPAEMFANAANTPVDISFIRRYKMKDGSTKTNPNGLSDQIDHPIGDSDRRVGLVYFKRENAPEIALINFQTHADTIGGEKFSADFPKFVRDTYEGAIENSLCMFINGAEGDTNHFNFVKILPYRPKGYEMAKHMGRTIAGTAISVRALAQKVEGDTICTCNRIVKTEHNKAKNPEDVERSKMIVKLYEEGRIAEYTDAEGMELVTILAEARRIVNMSTETDIKELHISGLSIGNFALIGFPGEPFTEIGLKTKEASKFDMTFVSCCTNGYEGYYPVESAYAEGGYEAKTSRYKAGIAETLINTATEMLDTLYNEANK